MEINEEDLLLGLLINKNQTAYVGVHNTKENFDKCCDHLYSHLLTRVDEGDPKWVFLFSVLFSVVRSIELSRPDLMKQLHEIKKEV